MPERDQGWLAKTHYWCTMLLVMFPVLPLRATAGLIIVWCALGLAIFFVHGMPLDRRKVLLALAFGCLPILYAIDLLRVDTLRSGTFLLEKSLALLFVPFAMALNPTTWNLKQIQRVLDVFSLAALALGVWANVVFLLNGPSAEHVNNVMSYGYRMEFGLTTGVQPTYAALFFFFAALAQLHVFLKGAAHGWAKVVRWVMFLALMAFGLLTAARTPILAFIVVLSVFLARRYGWKKGLLPGAIAAGMLIFIAFTFTPLKERFGQVFQTEVAMPHGEQHNSVNVRYGIIHCTFDLLEEHWLLGTGAGNQRVALEVCYKGLDTPVYSTAEFNTHNQYLDLWLSFGLIGLVAVVAIYWLPLRLALRSGEALYLGFILLFVICCVTENLLARQMGVVFYAVFNSLFAFMVNASNKHPA